MLTSYVSILFAQSERGNRKNEDEEEQDCVLRRKKYGERKKQNDEKQKNQISFCQLIQFLPNSHARTQKASEKKTYAQLREDEKKPTRQWQYESHVA